MGWKQGEKNRVMERIVKNTEDLFLVELLVGRGLEMIKTYTEF